MKRYNNETMKNGFTLLEVIIAVSLITTGITGVFILINKTIGLMSDSPSRLIAAYLAQEGIEIVRNIRDTNWIEGNDWDGDIICDSPPCERQVDYTTNALFDDPATTDPDENECSPAAAGYNCNTYSASYLQLESSGSGFYNYTSGDSTKFKRKIEIDGEDLDGDSDNGYEKLKVTVVVSWVEKRKSYSFSVQENLYNWH